MKHIADSVASKKKFLFLGDTSSSVALSLKKFARLHSISVLSQNNIDQNTLDDITEIFYFNPSKNNTSLRMYQNARIIIVFTSNSKADHRLSQAFIEAYPDTIKIVFFPYQTDDLEPIESILGFVLSNSNEQVLHLRVRSNHEKLEATDNKSKSKWKRNKNSSFFIWTLMLTCISQFIFMIPLIASYLLLYTGQQSFRKNEIEKSSMIVAYTKEVGKITTAFYTISKPLFSFLYLDGYIKNAISTVDLAQQTIETSIKTVSNAKQLVVLVNDDKRTTNIPEIELRLETLKKQALQLEKNTKTLADKLENMPFVKSAQINDLNKLNDTLKQINTIIPIIPNLLAKDGQKHYVVFFYNNMELRPGGGFLGSFAKIIVEKYKVKKITFLDVYDADGQLKGHIEPPDAIKNYLDQPHFFLRDSNFSPDFVINSRLAESFLNDELGIEKIDGFIGVTTTALSNLLSSFPPLYLSDYNETITNENFYLKTQQEIEEKKFVGSKSKKNWLSSIAQAIIANTDKVSFAQFAQLLKQSLDEKHIVLNDKDPQVNKIFQTNGWTGENIFPSCLSNAKCVTNYMAPIDANLGVNKSNYYVTRQMRFLNTLTSTNLKTEFFIVFNNESPDELPPGGIYKNYFQLFIPKNSTNVSVSLNEHLSSDFTSRESGQFRIVSQYLIVNPQETSTLKISYDLPLVPEIDSYQLVIQKQIGSINNEISLAFQSNVERIIEAKNFEAIEKNNQLLYNTSLLTDRIFLINIKK